MSKCGTAKSHHPKTLLVLIAAMLGQHGVAATAFGDDLYNEVTMPTDFTHQGDAGDLSTKAEILNSPEWRRAVFELGHWLDSQQIYTASEVASIKSDFNSRVARMSSYELRYMLNDLDAKFQVMDTPEARDARAWLGHYLSAASDMQKSRLLKEVPDVTKMTASELASKIQNIESEKQLIYQRQLKFDQSRQGISAFQQQSIAATQHAVASVSSASSYSPYRSGGEPPFSDVKVGGSVHVTAGPAGAYVSF